MQDLCARFAGRIVRTCWYQASCEISAELMPVGHPVIASNGYIPMRKLPFSAQEIAAKNQCEMGRAQEQAVMVNDTRSPLE